MHILLSLIVISVAKVAKTQRQWHWLAYEINRLVRSESQ